jgi:hypothetical protein
MLQPRRKPKRAYSAAAVVFGVGLAVFELRRYPKDGPEIWFWLFVAALMITLGLFGLFQKDTPDRL